jgi:succinate-semialdehyde dehydrogenase/glutarate-semialdehyde dehydrogenase
MMQPLFRAVTSKPALRSYIQHTNRLSVLPSSRTYASMQHSVPPLNDKSLLKSQAYVNGQWVDAKSGKTFEVTDPASHKVIGTMPEMDKEDVTAAIQAAEKALVSFRKTTGRERAKMLRKWYDLMIENSEDLARLITWENGKPLADAKGEVTYAANFFEWFSEEAPRVYGDTIPATVPGNRVFTVKEPVGVAGLITP